MGDNHFVRQHEHLRVPQGWTGQDKALVIQLERILDDIYKRFGRLGMKDLDEEVQGKLSPVSKESDGLCPQLPNETATSKYLRQDGEWGTPPDTKYESKAAASGGMAVSLCTTGEKYTWNNKADDSAVVHTSDIKNNTTTTTAGFVADARIAKTLNDKMGDFEWCGSAGVGSSSSGGTATLALPGFARTYIIFVYRATGTAANTMGLYLLRVNTEAAGTLILAPVLVPSASAFTSLTAAVTSTGASVTIKATASYYTIRVISL